MLEASIRDGYPSTVPNTLELNAAKADLKANPALERTALIAFIGYTRQLEAICSQALGEEPKVYDRTPETSADEFLSLPTGDPMREDARTRAIEEVAMSRYHAPEKFSILPSMQTAVQVIHATPPHSRERDRIVTQFNRRTDNINRAWHETWNNSARINWLNAEQGLGNPERAAAQAYPYTSEGADKALNEALTTVTQLSQWRTYLQQTLSIMQTGQGDSSLKDAAMESIRQSISLANTQLDSTLERLFDALITPVPEDLRAAIHTVLSKEDAPSVGFTGGPDERDMASYKQALTTLKEPRTRG